MSDERYIQGLVERARVAQKTFEAKFDQEAVDRIVRDIAKNVFDNARELAEMAVKETRMGAVEYKVKKNEGKARIMWYSLKGKKSTGVISHDEESGITEIAKPVGVVAAVQPTTNPTVTPMANCMAAVKTRNAIIIAPHPRAENTTKYSVKQWQQILVDQGAPADLIQLVEDGSVERTQELMRQCDVSVATGGPGMVKAAYSSGHPSFGVGQGNVQTIIDRDVDISETVKLIIDARIFDRGIICSGEQTMITPKDKYEELKREVIAYGGYWVDDEAEKGRWVKALFPEGKINRDLVGQSVEACAAAAGLTVPDGTKVIVIPEDAANKTSLLRKEKMFPVITPFSYDTFEEAIQIALDNLDVEGKGHSVSIHSHNDKHIRELGLRASVSRVLVNQPCATANGGAFTNSLNATSTLGCGSWGNNSISENFYYKHLLNITRIAKVKKHSRQPSDEEIWSLS
ncbi:MAG: aldehyde dehydrogenase family protein [Spirochaeta sp.]|jgi:succinate-semialdehyde dehydrogenase|nr:aldehyde dehydrogenase family protein [Spirochaeta sp.]